VILDEASYYWPVRPVWTVRCFYGPLRNRISTQTSQTLLPGTGPFSHHRRMRKVAVRVRVRVMLWFGLWFLSLLSRVLDNVQTAIFTSAKYAQYMDILRPGRKRTSKNQDVTSIFVYFHTVEQLRQISCLSNGSQLMIS